MTEARDLLLWSPDDLQNMQASRAEDWIGWSSDWLGGGTLDELMVRSMNECAPSGELTHMTWTPCDVDGAPLAGIWQGHTDMAHQLLASRMVEGALDQALPPHDWALGAAHTAIQDLERRWFKPALAHKAAHQAYSLAEALSPLMGGVIVTCPSLALHWLLSPDMAQTLLKTHRDLHTPPALQPVAFSQVLPAQRVSIQLGLRHVDISVADLTGLRVGDVVRFPSLLNDPLPVGVTGNEGPEARLQAQLGQHEGRVAIKVLGKTPAA